MSELSKGGAGATPHESRRPTIVVVDDSDIVLTATAETLERAGYRVLTRNRPSGCVAMILQEKPDLVLLDVCMPTVSGDTLVKLFSKASPDSHTIILLYSALDEPLLRSKAKASGAHGYIVKTSDNSALVRHVKRWLRPANGSRGALPAVSPAARGVNRPEPTNASSRRRFSEPVPRREEFNVTVSGEMRRPSGSHSLPAPTVLFVDDDMLVLSGYRRQLLGQPFEFEFALSGGQVLRRLKSATPPSVIVSDLLTSKPDGLEVLRQALDHDQNWSRRFIVVTNRPLHDAKRQLDRRFFGSLLKKPAGTDELVAAIRSSLLGASFSASSRTEARIVGGR